MSETNKDVRFRILGDTKPIFDSFKGIPDKARQAAKEAGDAWRSGVSPPAKQAGEDMKRAADDGAKAVAAAGKKIAELAGGPFSQLGQIVAELIPNSAKAAGSLGGLAGAAAGIGTAGTTILAAAAATWKLADAGLAAADRLRAAGKEGQIPEETLRGIESYRAATEELRTEWDKLLVTWGADAGRVIVGLTDELGRLRDGWQTQARELAGSQEGIEKYNATTARLRDTVVAVGSLGLVPLARYLRDVGAAAEESRPKVEALSDLAVEMALRETETEEARRKASAAAGERLLADRKRQAAAAAKAQRDMDATILAATEGDLRDHLDKVNAMRAASYAYKQELAREDAALDAQILAATQADAEAHFAKVRAMQAATFEAASAYREQAAAEEERYREAAIRAGWDTFEGVTSAARATQDLMFTLAENGTKKQKKAAEQFARYMRSVEIAQVLILGVRAVAQAAASAPPPFNLPAIAAATADAGARMVSLLATKIPTAYSGRPAGSGSGDGAVVVHRDESILTSRATEALLRLLSERLSPLSALEGLAAPTAAGGGDVYLDRRKVGRVLRQGGPPPGYRRPAR